MNKNILLLAGAAVAAVTMAASIKSLVTVDVQRSPAATKRTSSSSTNRGSSSRSRFRSDDGFLSSVLPMAAVASAFNTASDYCAPSSSYSSSSDSGSSYSSSCDSGGGF
jgi:hypothetical protein